MLFRFGGLAWAFFREGGIWWNNGAVRVKKYTCPLRSFVQSGCVLRHGAWMRAGSPHPVSIAADTIADRLFLARKVIAIKQIPYFLAAPVVDHELDGVVALEHLFHRIRGGDAFKNVNRMVRFTRVKQRQEPVVASDVAIEVTVRQGTVAMDHKGQGHLIEPWIERLADQFGRRIIADGKSVIQKTLPEGAWAFVVEEPGVEIEIAAPEFIGVGGVERGFEIQPELVIKGFPRGRVSGAVKLYFGPCVFTLHRGLGPREIKRHRGDVTGDQRVSVEEHERLTLGHGKKRFDLVAVGVAGPEVERLKGDDFCPQFFQKLAGLPAANAWVLAP